MIDTTTLPTPAEHLGDLFSTTVKSLEQDVVALKNLFSLRQMLTVENSKNCHDTIQQLHHIDQAIITLEEKVQILDEVLQEDVKAIDELTVLKKVIDDQAGCISQVEVDCANIRLPGDSQIEIQRQLNDFDKAANSTVSKHVHWKMEEGDEENSSHQTRTDSIQQSVSSKYNNVTAIAARAAVSITIPLLTESEFHALPKSLRGRITLAAVNDAAADIERVVRDKYAILEKRQKGTKQYNRALADHRELELDEHNGSHWISEQRLRDSCKFFRSGESTARCLLSILRSVKRLKQIPSRSHVTYKLLETVS